MATKAPLTHFSQRASHDPSSLRMTGREDRGWREIFMGDNPDMIWNELAHFISSKYKTPPPDLDHMVQQVFIQLLIAGRITAYTEKAFSDAEIEREILLMAGLA